MGNTRSIMSVVREKICEAFQWLKAKVQGFLNYLSKMITDSFNHAMRFSEGFNAKLVQSKLFVDEVIAKLLEIVSNISNYIVSNLIKVKGFVASMLKLMRNTVKTGLEMSFDWMNEEWEKVEDIFCDICVLVEGFLELLEILSSGEPVSVVFVVMEAVSHYLRFPGITVSEMKHGKVFKTLPDGQRKAAVFACFIMQKIFG